MKLRRVLAILALLAAVVLPVAAAPAVLTGNIYTGAITDGTNWNGYLDFDIYINAAVDDFNTVYANIGRQLLTYNNAVTAITVLGATENINWQYGYVQTHLDKFLALDKSLLIDAWTGYYYWGTGAYASKLVAAYPRVAYRYTTAPAWAFMLNVGLPAPMAAGIKFAVAPFAPSAVGQPYAFTNDFIVVPYANLNLGGGLLVDIDASYYQNKNATIGKGVITAEGGLTMTAGTLKIEGGAGIDLDLNTNLFMYMASGRGTFYLDDKSLTFVQGAVGLRGSFPATGTTYAVDRVELNAQITLMPQMDILECVTLDLTSTTAPFRSADTAVRLKIGALQYNIGYLYGNNAGAVWGSANLTPSTGNVGGAYIRVYAPF